MLLNSCSGGRNMIFDCLTPFPAPEKVIIKDVDGDTWVPYERVKSYDDKEFVVLRLQKSQ